MRGLKRIQSASTIAAGHAFVQNLRRGHYELTAELPSHDRIRTAFAELKATGMTVARRSADNSATLTPQEFRIAQLAATAAPPSRPASRSCR